MMLCCLHDGFNGTVGLSLSQVFLESISEDGQLAIGLEATEGFLGLQQAGGGPSELHLGVSALAPVPDDPRPSVGTAQSTTADYAVTSQRTRYRHEHPASCRTSRACGNLCNCPRQFAVTVAPCSVRGGNGKAPVRDVWERTPAAWTPRGDLFVNGGGIMHHAEWLGGPVAAAQKCAPMSPCRL